MLRMSPKQWWIGWKCFCCGIAEGSHSNFWADYFIVLSDSKKCRNINKCSQIKRKHSQKKIIHELYLFLVYTDYLQISFHFYAQQFIGRLRQSTLN